MRLRRSQDLYHPQALPLAALPQLVDQSLPCRGASEIILRTLAAQSWETTLVPSRGFASAFA